MCVTTSAVPFTELLQWQENASGRLDIVAARYLEFVKRECPALTEAEWCSICDVYIAHFHASSDDARSILHQLEDGDEFEEVGDKRAADVRQLCRKLEANGTEGMFAPVEAALRYWLLSKVSKLASHYPLRHR